MIKEVEPLVAPHKSASRISVDVSPDGLKAWIVLNCLDAPPRMTVAGLIDTLTKANIAIDGNVSRRVRELAARRFEGNQAVERILVATGRPVIEGTDGEFQWLESLECTHRKRDEEDSVDHYAFNSVVTVEKDQIIGTLVRAKPAEPGIDVFGRPLAPQGTIIDVTYDETVEVEEEDPAVVTAAVAGKVTYQDHHLSISEVFEVPQDVDFSTGHIDSSVDVHVPGVIRDRFHVRSKRTIWVDGTIEGARVVADVDIHATGGIPQREIGYLRAKGQITAKFGDHAVIRAGQDITIARDLVHCDVRCWGSLAMPNGAIIGGQAFARESIRAAVLGSSVGVETLVCVGHHPSILRKAERIVARIRARRCVSKRIRRAVVQLREELGRLNATQQGRFMDLEGRADAIDQDIKRLEARRADLLGSVAPTRVPTITVGKMIHPGVCLRIGSRQAVIEEPIPGPVRIEERTGRGATVLVAASTIRGSALSLRTTCVTEEAPPE